MSRRTIGRRYVLGDDLYTADDRRKHLDMVQAVVARMAAASSTTKGWLLPVITATYGYALAQHAFTVALLGMVAAGIFGILDAHYLRQERAFRVLFKAVASGRVGGYDMNVRRYFHKSNGDEGDEQDKNCHWRFVISSWALAGFYGPMIGTGIAVAIIALVLH